MVRRFRGLSARSQRVVFVFLTLSVLLGAWHTWLSPARLLVDSRRSKRDAAITELARLRITSAGLPKLQREVQALEARIAAQPSGGSNTPEPETLLEAIHELATRSGLELVRFTHAPAAGGATTGGERTQLELEGRFHDVVAFLGRLSASGRLASAPEVTIKLETTPTGRRMVIVTVLADARLAATPTAVPDVFFDTAVTSDSRDPFTPPRFSVSASSGGVGAPGARSAVAAGLSGVSANDVTVTGIVRAGDVVSAILQAPDRRTFLAKPQDRLLDATVKSVDAGGVVFARAPRGGAAHPAELRKPLGKPPGAVR